MAYKYPGKVQISAWVDVGVKRQFDHAEVDSRRGLTMVINEAMEREAMRSDIVDCDQRFTDIAKAFMNDHPDATKLAIELQLMTEYFMSKRGL